MITLTKEEARFLLDLLNGIQDMITDKAYDDIALLYDDINEALEVLTFPVEEDAEWEGDEEIEAMIREAEEEMSNEQCV